MKEIKATVVLPTKLAKMFFLINDDEYCKNLCSLRKAWFFFQKRLDFFPPSPKPDCKHAAATPRFQPRCTSRHDPGVPSRALSVFARSVVERVV